MKKLLIALSVIGFLFILLLSVMRSSIETPDYEVLRVLSRKAEIRRYPDLILAQTQLDSNTYSVNSSLGFRRVAGYIFGANEQNEKIAMTSPVVMEMGSNETIKQAVMAGMGISFLSLHTIGLELEHGLIAILDVEGTPIVRAWNVVHTLSKLLSPSAEAFRYFMLEHAEKYLADKYGRHLRLLPAG